MRTAQLPRVRLLSHLFLGVIILLSACNRSGSQATIFVPPTVETSLTPVPTWTPIPTPTATPTATPPPTPLPAVRIHSGDQALMEGDYERALSEYQQALVQSDESMPENRAAALLGVGRSWLESGNTFEAERSLKQLVETYPDASQTRSAFFFLGRLYDDIDRPTEAAQAYNQYLELRPGRIDAYILDRRAEALFSAGEYLAAAEEFRAALLVPSTLDRIFIQLKMARAYALAEDYNTALTLYEDADTRTSDDYTHALIALRKGQVYQAQGMHEQAMTIYLACVENYPRAYEAYSALQALDQAGVQVKLLPRGLVSFFAQEYGAAMAAFDRYLQQEEPEDPATALYYYGLANFELGGYSEALKQWDKLIDTYPNDRYWDDAWEQKAYTQWAFLEDFDAAETTLLGFVEKAPGHARAAEFLLDAALVAERDRDLQQAAALFTQVFNVYPDYEKALRALFLAGITQYRLEDYPAALQSFQRFQGVAVRLQDRAGVSFWIGKTQLAQGDPDAAQSTWQTTANIDPTGYYSERARDLLDGRTLFQPPASFDLGVDLDGERSRAEDWLRATFKLASDKELGSLGELANDPGIMRGTELWGLGLFDEARAEFEAVRLAIQEDPTLTYRLTNYLLDIGLYRSAITAARQILSLAYLDDSLTISAPAYFNHVRFGSYYADLILPLAQARGIHPLFLFAVVRQESLFEGFVRSNAGARGLMQIIPSTGDDLAKNLGWPQPYSAEDLYRPVVSLTFGAEYLARLRKAFDGDLYATLAAYNAGPGNAQQWLRLAPDDPDLFLEVIRYEETRNYIRGVYELFTLYRMIYSRTP